MIPLLHYIHTPLKRLFLTALHSLVLILPYSHDSGKNFIQKDRQIMSIRAGNEVFAIDIVTLIAGNQPMIHSIPLDSAGLDQASPSNDQLCVARIP